MVGGEAHFAPSAAVRAEHRHQCLIGVATYLTVSLHRADGDAGISLFALLSSFARSALRSLWALSSRLTLCPGHTLNSLCTLRARRSLRSRIAFSAGLFATCGKR
jgi:hypothetical protein